MLSNPFPSLPTGDVRSSPMAHTQRGSGTAARAKTPATSTARHVPYLLVRVRVRPERHRPQSCAIALRSLAPEGSYLILSLIPALISILRGRHFFSRYHLPLYLDRPSNYNIVFGCPSKYNDGRWPHARHPKEQARVWYSIFRFHHTPAHPIYWEDHFASCVRGHRRCR